MPFFTVRDIFAACGLTVAALIGYLIFNGIYSAFIGPLRKVPGPKLAAMSHLVYMFKGAQGIRWRWLQKELTPKYGKIFRIAPDIVLVSDKDEVKRILVTEDWRKSELMAGLRITPEAATLFNATDKEYHKKRRRMLSHAFSVKFLNSLEPLMDDIVVDMVEKIHESIKIQGYAKGGIINIAQLLTFFTLDVIGATAFGGSFEMVKTGYHPFPDSITYEQQVRLLRSFFPPLKYVVQLPSYNYKFVTDIIRKRRQLESGTAPRDLLQLLLDAYDKEESGISEAAVYDQLLELLVGGSDTIAFTMIVTLIQLAKHPEVLQRAMNEIDDACKDVGVGQLPTHSALKDLPYLNACINESLRLWPPAPEIPSPRVSEEDVVVCGHWFPKGTTFFTNFYPLHHSAEYWGSDVEEYKPERWIGGNIPQDAYYPFSAGSRYCIGSKFAWMEMRIVIATLLLKFNFKDIAGQRHDDIVQFISPHFNNDTYNLAVTPRT